MKGGIEILKQQRIEAKLKRRKGKLNQLLNGIKDGAPTSNQK